MNQTVEAGKTLLVDGPASVAVTSGSVEVFGSMLNKSGKIVIREGKRLPFAVHEKATFEISLGENANTEEVEGDTVPISWIESFEEISHFQNKPITVMVLGTVDSGKTSFCTYLANKLLPLKQKIAILDGDLGQSDIGPPCAVAYTFVTKPIADLFDLKAKNAFFIGVTSPSGAADKVIKGLAALRKEVVDANPDLLVINTDGWVQGEEAIKYKIQLVEELKPDIVFCIQQKDELEPIVNSLGQIRKVIVEFPQAVRQRSREKRRNLRELGYMKYLRNAKMQSYPLGWIKIEENEMLPASVDYGKMTYASKIFEILQMKPLHFSQLQNRIWMVIGKRRWISAHNIEKVEAFTQKKVVLIRKGDEQGLLIALYGNNRKFLGIGVLREIDYARKTLKVFTPVSEEVSTVSVGKVKLDKNLRENPILTQESETDLVEFKNLA